ncbi:hypothetical protein G6F46_000888 [Rhizopus delemar]|uniref:Uncharacterized protein n=2 Tax=Rhizopus TaxID=4842 RepID=I1BVF3_RHIO9|nr:hypothetical protein RO3G_04888 [Rhizopus delemar RA 99-880]KAG1460026.1 hypothetical protein G6F55_004413 [Rhizopus delemar]KAG1544582.1 hypothetical protein G6F51_005973 [Rhizopus arrhizus]KAG1498351.1 hypothetical protein G6F54_005141 [Rhizopus delemar]KAG1527072.1 hypothetical protein G6F52_001867 [Rhizopus delemar]|eukprot:EIE80183.1 hypothetical protein RO3G_04888 [Rhizopus delemar RA 99-880]
MIRRCIEYRHPSRPFLLEYYQLPSLAILKHLINQAQSVCKITTDLLLFSSSLNYEKRRAIIDIVLLILKPSRDPIVDVTDISESELWTIYLDPLLSTIVSDNERNTLLRWLKKQAEDNLLRPDASITLIDQLQVGAHLGFGKVKIIQPTCDKAALCSDSFTFNPSNQRMPR